MNGFFVKDDLSFEFEGV